MKKIFVFGLMLVLLTSSSVFAGDLPTITILINDSPWFPGFDALVNMYIQETGNDVKLNVTPFPGMLQKSRNAVQAKESEYDILNLNEQWYMQFYADKLVTPIKEIDPNFELDPQVIEYEWSPRWDEKAGYSTENGEIYGLPINGNIQLFFYRKDIFEEKGLAVPETWEQVIENAKAVMNPPRMHGFVIRSAPSNWQFQAFLKGHGGDIMTLNGESGEWAVTIHKDEAVQALKTWMLVGREYGPANYADIGQAEMMSLMLSGKLAQVTMVGAAAPNYDDEKKSVVVGKVGATVVPGITSDMRSTMSGIWVMGIPHNLLMERKQAALTFLEWALTKEAQMAYAKAGAIPVRQDVYDELANDPKLGWWMQAMAASTPYIKAQPRLKETPQIVDVINRRTVEAVIDKLSPEDALWEAAQEIHKILVDGGYKVSPLER
ncbi:MAG: extracellular solute-binding protein [bacterium]|nr:extracellular solute-binding protein [bacterium]